jgi:hypothetical protein
MLGLSMSHTAPYTHHASNLPQCAPSGTTSRRQHEIRQQRCLTPQSTNASTTPTRLR